MKSNKQANPVIHPNLAETKKPLKKFYLEFANTHQNSTLGQTSNQFLSKFLEISGFVLDNAGPAEYSFQSHIDSKSTQAWPVFKELFSYLSDWINKVKLLTVKEQKAQETVLQNIEKSIRQYQALSKSAKSGEETDLSKKILSIFLESKKKIKNLYKKKPSKFSFRTEASPQEIKSISDIFNFYAKQHIMTGRNPTFDKLGELIENMDSGSFLAFSKHFGICRKGVSERSLLKEAVLRIFKRSATLQKSMNLQGFISALDEIAEIYFNEEYDNVFCVKFAGFDLNKKRIMLYEVLKLESPYYVAKTCVPIRNAFRPSPGEANKAGVKENEEQKEEILKYKQGGNYKTKGLPAEKGKKVSGISKIAEFKVKEMEDLRNRKDGLKLEDIEKEKFQDLETVKQLEGLIYS